ncbi:hypothetical protein LIER_11550 [Lithospermum erythrorhizon]|uniref:Uncharacterized protein n=1 Tax=Lithospermum erythrorhizon TaxID=34254 RepID=A0AAV3PNG7_LITER
MVLSLRKEEFLAVGHLAVSQPQATRLTPSIGSDAGEIQFHHPRTPHHMSERFSPTSIATPCGAPSSSTPLAAGNVKHRYERLSSSLISSSHDASGSSAHLPGGNVSLRFTKSPTKNRHGDPVSTLRPHTSSYSSANTSYEDMRPDMFQPIPQAPLIPQVIGIHSSVKRDHTGSNVHGHPLELANRVPLQRLGKHVKFDLP